MIFNDCAKEEKIKNPYLLKISLARTGSYCAYVKRLMITILISQYQTNYTSVPYMNIPSQLKKNSTIKRRIRNVGYIIIRTQKDMIISVSQCGSVVSSVMHIAQFNQLGGLKKSMAGCSNIFYSKVSFLVDCTKLQLIKSLNLNIQTCFTQFLCFFLA